jgi:hypothetical protein
LYPTFGFWAARALNNTSGGNSCTAITPSASVFSRASPPAVGWLMHTRYRHVHRVGVQLPHRIRRRKQTESLLQSPLGFSSFPFRFVQWLIVVDWCGVLMWIAALSCKPQGRFGLDAAGARRKADHGTERAVKGNRTGVGVGPRKKKAGDSRAISSRPAKMGKLEVRCAPSCCVLLLRFKCWDLVAKMRFVLGCDVSDDLRRGGEVTSQSLPWWCRCCQPSSTLGRFVPMPTLPSTHRVNKLA